VGKGCGGGGGGEGKGNFPDWAVRGKTLFQTFNLPKTVDGATHGEGVMPSRGSSYFGGIRSPRGSPEGQQEWMGLLPRGRVKIRFLRSPDVYEGKTEKCRVF